MDSHAADIGAGEGRRVEELLRVNERLAAEVRSLALGRTGQPRSSSMTAARRLGALVEERDQLRQRLEEMTEALEVASRSREELERHRDELERHRAELAAELGRLRGGRLGLVRRARARLRRR